MKKAFWVLAIFVLICLSCFSQPDVIEDPYLKFSHLTKKEGLSGNYILDFLQDSEGYMWIATTNGLNRYDGYSIRQFLHVPHDSLSLSDNLVTCLVEYKDSLILVGTRTGLNYFHRDGEYFSLVDYSFPESIFLAQKYIRAMLVDEDVVWIETADGELVKMNPMTHDIAVFKHRPPSMVNTYFYHVIFKKPDGHLLLGGRYMGLLRFDPATSTFTETKTEPDNPAKKRDEDAATYFMDATGNYWVGGIDGLYTFNPETENYTKQLSISSFGIIEPRRNELWIATGNGLFRFLQNENCFYQSRHNDNTAQSLSHNHINKIYSDRSGNIWIGTLDGINIFQPTRNKFRHFFHIPENPKSPVSNHITALNTDQEGRIWLGTRNAGIDCFDEQWQKLFHYDAEREAPFNLASNAVSVLKADPDGDIWVGQWSGRGFNIINPDKKTNFKFQMLRNELKCDWYNDFLFDSEGNNWIGIWGAQGLYVFDKTNGTITNDRFLGTPQQLNQPIYSMASDGTMIWLAFKGQLRFYCFDPELEKLSFYSYKNYHPFDIKRVDSIRQLRDQTWFFTDNGAFVKEGEDYYDFKPVDIEDYKAKAPDTTMKKAQIASAIDAIVNDLAGDKNGNVWAATNQGLYKTTGNLPVARYHKGDGQSGELLSDTIHCLVYHPPCFLWLGTAKGLVKFDIENKQFTAYHTERPRYISSHLIKFLFEDSKNQLWIGTTNKGLNCMIPETGEIIQYPGNPNDAVSFWGTQATCMAEDGEGNLWIGGEGLNRFHPESNRFSHFTSKDGLADDQVMAILTDDNDRLWISTANGLSCFNPHDSSFVNYYISDGLQDNEFSGAACKLSNGQLLFGGKNGFNIIDPDIIPINTHVPNVRLTGFSIFEEDQTGLLSDDKPIHLKYHQNYFSFTFTALDFSNPENNRYRYKLENLDDNWINAGSQNRKARYTNVDPGEYIFKVIAANNDGAWNETGVSIPVVISPPFWKTNFFYALIITSIVLLIVAWVKYREKQIREQNRYLVLEQKLLRSQMNPHFIFNSLSSIQSFIFENKPVVAGSYLSRFSELMRSILYNSREEFIALEKEVQTLQNYLELQQLRFQNKFKFELIIDPEIEPDTMKIPPMLAQPFIENAIEHGLKELDQQGVLKIEFFLHERMLQIKVEDNGIGIEEARKRKLQKVQEHQSLATVITRERIEILNKGRKERLYTLTIGDRKNANGEVEGTRVEFKVPVH